MRPGLLLVASGVSVALAGAACGSPCRAIAAEQRVLRERTATATTAHARVQVPYAVANQVMAELLQTPPEVPVRLRRLGPLQPFIRDVRAVPREVVVGPAGRGKVHFDVHIELRDRSGELLTLKARTEVEPVLEHSDGQVQLSIGLGADEVLRFEPELGARGAGVLGRLLADRLPGPIRARIPQSVIDLAAGEIIGELVEHAYTLLRGPLLRRLGEVTALRVRLPDLPVARVDIFSMDAPVPALVVHMFTTLPVRAGLAAAPAPEPGVVSVQIAGSTVAELANWAVDNGALPRRYTRLLKPDPSGPFVPRMDWRADDARRPLVVHLFQVDRGCSHFQVGARPLLRVHRGVLVATLRDRTLERAQGTLLVRAAGWLNRLVELSVDKSRQAAARTRITVGGHVLDTRLTRATVAGNEVRFALELSAARPLASAHPHATR